MRLDKLLPSTVKLKPYVLDTPAANIFFMVLTSLFAQVNANESLTLSFASDNWCPYICESEDSPGYAVEVTRQIYSSNGHQVKFFKIPFKRALIDTQNHQFDAVLLVSDVDLRDYHLTSGEKTIAVGDTVFFVHRSSEWVFKDLDPLNSLRLGLINGYKYGEDIDALIAHSGSLGLISWSHGALPVKQNISKLVRQRVDVIIDNQAVITYTAAKMESSNAIKFAGSASVDDPLFIGFSNKHPFDKQLAKKFDEGIAELRQKGELEKILAKYGLSDWEQMRN